MDSLAGRAGCRHWQRGLRGFGLPFGSGFAVLLRRGGVILLGDEVTPLDLLGADIGEEFGRSRLVLLFGQLLQELAFLGGQWVLVRKEALHQARVDGHAHPFEFVDLNDGIGAGLRSSKVMSSRKPCFFRRLLIGSLPRTSLSASFKLL